MKTANLRLCLLLGCVVLFGPGFLGAQDWPQWRGPNRDARVTGFTAPTTWPKELTQKWKVMVGDGVATPALVGDKLYVFSRENGNEIIRCLNANSGKEIWQDKYETGGTTGGAAAFPGPRCSPTVADGKVITLGVRGILSCLDTASGKVVWRKDTKSVPKFYTSSSPVVTDDVCIAQIGTDKNGAVAAYDLATGTEKWKWADNGTAYASPVLLSVDGTKAVVAETQQNVAALGVADGKLLWKTPFAASGMREYNASTPIVEGDTLVFGGSSRGIRAFKIEKKDGALAGKELWSNNDNSVKFNTPVVKDGMVFGLSERNNLFCINKDGKTAWSSPIGAASGGGGGSGGGRGMRGQGGHGTIVDAGSVLLALTPNAQLVVFQPSDKKLEKLASYKVGDAGTYAYPILAGNRIFVKDKDSVYLWTIP